MKTGSTIKAELLELGSSLVTQAQINVYTVPEGYFNSLPEIMFDRVHAIGMKDSVQHSALLNAIGKTTPYSAPENYFDEMPQRMLKMVRNKTEQVSSLEEIQELSPLLGSLQRELPYTVPVDYFASIEHPVLETKSAKVISLGGRKWLRLAAAAVITGVIALGSFLVFNNEKVTPTTDAYAWVKKSVKQVSTDKLSEFIELVNEEKAVENNVATTNGNKDVKDLMQGVPESEIQNFLNDTEVLDEPDTDESVMN